MSAVPAALVTVLARIDALKARFEPTASAGSEFGDVLGQVTGTDGTGGSSDGAASGVTADLARLPKSERDLIIREAKQDGVDPALALAVVLQESGGNPTAVSPAGALGLMQLMPGTAKELGVTDPFDPAQNVAGGVEYLREKLAEFGSTPLALAAYNAGSGVVSAWGGIPPYAETQGYVSRVLSARDQIARELAADPGSRADSSSASIRGAAASTDAAVTGSGGPPRTVPTAAPSSSKPATPSSGTGPEHDDPSIHGMVVRTGSDALAMQATAKDGQDGPVAQDATPSGAASTTSTSVGATQEAAQRDALGSLGGATGMAHQGGQGQSGGDTGAGQWTGQAMPPTGSSASTGASSASGALTSDSLARMPASDPSTAGVSSGPVTHLTVRSGGDAPVTVTLTDRTDAVSGRVVTQTPAMAQVLRDHVDGLRTALATQHIQLSGLAVRPAAGTDQSPRGQQGRDARPPRPPQTFVMSLPDGEEASSDVIG
ncbi:MAG TPA: transglycosylase SLT domain-containing protein [bacterium]|nr:transglycosylase SLT domain-containing protein [bacterium]